MPIRVRQFDSMELQITVAMAATYVSDPTGDLLEMIETLLPQAPPYNEALGLPRGPMLTSYNPLTPYPACHARGRYHASLSRCCPCSRISRA